MRTFFVCLNGCATGFLISNSFISGDILSGLFGCAIGISFIGYVVCIHKKMIQMVKDIKDYINN